VYFFYARCGWKKSHLLSIHYKGQEPLLRCLSKGLEVLVGNVRRSIRPLYYGARTIGMPSGADYPSKFLDGGRIIGCAVNGGTGHEDIGPGRGNITDGGRIHAPVDFDQG